MENEQRVLCISVSLCSILGLVVVTLLQRHLVRLLGAIVYPLREHRQIPADRHEARDLELDRVAADEVVRRLEGVAKQPSGERTAAEAVARLALVVRDELRDRECGFCRQLTMF